MEKKIENGYNIIFYINEAGNYDLDIKANIDHSNSYIGIVNFKITCNSTPDEKKLFPKFTSDYKNDDNIELISPIDNELNQGQNYNFEIISNYNDLYLLLGTGTKLEYIVMEKDGTNFRENNVMIHGEFVQISYKNNDDGIYYPLVEYTTKGENIDFPSTYITPFKKRLESPLKTKLIRGEEYNFKIICDTTYSIKIYFNSEWYPLNKNENIYTYTFTIPTTIPGGTSVSNLEVMYGPIELSYHSMYTYNIE